MKGTVFIDDASSAVGRALARQAQSTGMTVVDGAGDPSGEVIGGPLVPSDPSEFSVTPPVALSQHAIDRMFLCRRPVGEGSVEELTTGDWERLVIGYLTWLRVTVQAGLRAMSGVRAGSITILLDPDAEAAVPHSLVGATTAAACGGFIRAVALDVAKDRVRVNGVIRGIAAPLESEPREDLKRAARTASLGWEAVPMLAGVRAVDLARAMWFLSGPRSRSTTGSLLRVDGGVQAQRFRKRQLGEVGDVS